MPVELPLRFEDQPLLWTVPAVYSPSECADFIQMIERSAPTLATNNPCTVIRTESWSTTSTHPPSFFAA